MIYILYDGRAIAYNDTDEASVLATATSLEESKTTAQFFNEAVCYSYDTSGEYLTEETFVYYYNQQTGFSDEH